MRTELLSHLTTALTGTIRASSELPWSEGGAPLYTRNLRRVYLAEPETQQRELIATLDDTDIAQTVISVQGFLTVDARNRNTDLDTVLTQLAEARNISTITNAFRKEFDYSATTAGDQLRFEFEYRFHIIT